MARLLPRSAVWFLPLSLALAAALRFDALSERGLLYWDEGKFSLEGIRLLGLLRAFPAAHGAALAGKAIGTAKPTHALLIALSYRLFGVHDYAPLLLNATASVAQVAVLFFLGRQLFGTRVALVAATILSASGYDIIYARSALSESDANLLFLVAVLLWWNGCMRPRLLPPSRRRACYVIAGIVLGIAFTTNYRLIVYIATLVVVDLSVSWKREGWRITATSALCWGAGLALLPTLWQVIGMIAQSHGVVLFRGEITYRPTSYWSEALYQLHSGKQSVLRFNPVLYPEWYIVRQGWPLSLLLLIGLGAAAMKRSLPWIMPAVLVLIPYGMYIFAPFIVPRNLDAAVPFAALLSAAALVGCMKRIHLSVRPGAGLILATMLLAEIGATQALPLTSVRSGFAQAAQYVDQHRSPGALALNEVMVFYLRDPGRGCDAPSLPREVAALTIDDRSGDEYAVIDDYTTPMARYLARHAERVARFSTVGPASLGENLIASENGQSPWAATPQHVDVYALDTLHVRLHRLISPQQCTQSRLA